MLQRVGNVVNVHRDGWGMFIYCYADGSSCMKTSIGVEAINNDSFL